MAETMRSEKDLSNWFIENYRKVGYQKIIKDNKGRFPDFIMSKDNKARGVELEILSSNFLSHKHDINKVDDIVCLIKDINLKANIIELSNLEYIPKVVRVSATVDKKTIKILDEIMKSGKYRNKSHIVEEAINLMEEKYAKNKK